jgi:hypothetical protein
MSNNEKGEPTEEELKFEQEMAMLCGKEYPRSLASKALCAEKRALYKKTMASVQKEARVARELPIVKATMAAIKKAAEEKAAGAAVQRVEGGTGVSEARGGARVSEARARRTKRKVHKSRKQKTRGRK